MMGCPFPNRTRSVNMWPYLHDIPEATVGILNLGISWLPGLGHLYLFANWRNVLAKLVAT